MAEQKQIYSESGVEELFFETFNSKVLLSKTPQEGKKETFKQVLNDLGVEYLD